MQGREILSLAKCASGSAGIGTGNRESEWLGLFLEQALITRRPEAASGTTSSTSSAGTADRAVVLIAGGQRQLQAIDAGPQRRRLLRGGDLPEQMIYLFVLRSLRFCVVLASTTPLIFAFE